MHLVIRNIFGSLYVVLGPWHQDRSIQQEQCDEQHNPSEKTILQQKEVVQSMWAHMENDEPLIPSLTSGISSTSFPSSAGATGSTRQKPIKSGNSKNTGASQPGRSAASKPAVEAAKQRAKTMKDYKAVEVGLARAKALGHHILDIDALKVHNGDQAWLCECVCVWFQVFATI